jgi:uncharacterized protein YaiE (UPF0345 family)
MANVPAQFTGVTVLTKANVYFDGKVVSHSLLFPDGRKKTLGVIQPGRFHFSTDQAERMEIVAGTCHVKLDGRDEVTEYVAGGVFEVPAKSGFDIEVKTGQCEYICSFLD